MKQFFIICSILLAQISFAQDKITVPEGKTFSGKMKSDQTVSMGMGIESRVLVNSTFNSRILKVEDSIIRVEVTVTKVAASNESAYAKEIFNSETGEGQNTELAKSLDSLLNRADTFYIDRFTGFIARSVTTLAEEFGDTGGSPDKVGEFVLYPFPSGFKDGDTWSISQNIEKMTTTTTYTLNRFINNKADIDYKTTTTGVFTSEADGMSFDMNIDGVTSGNMVVNKDGLVEKRTMNINMTGLMEIMGQKMEINIKGITEVEIDAP